MHMYISAYTPPRQASARGSSGLDKDGVEYVNIHTQCISINSHMCLHIHMYMYMHMYISAYTYTYRDEQQRPAAPGYRARIFRSRQEWGKRG